MAKLPVANIQRFCTHDGEGIRTTVFLKGCPLQCKWCHNPETQEARMQISYNASLCVGCRACETVCCKDAHTFENGVHKIDQSKCGDCTDCASACAYTAIETIGAEKSITDIVNEVKKDEMFYGKQGGMTLSGGEPMLHGDVTVELLKEVKRAGFNVYLETSGYFSSEFVSKVCGVVDCFLWDVKDTVSERHKKYTGVSNERTLENLRLVDSFGGKTVMRCIMVNGVNTDTAHLDGIARLYKELKHCLRVEIFSYHDYGVGKYYALGKDCPSKKEWITSIDELKQIQKYLKNLSVKCKITGI